MKELMVNAVCSRGSDHLIHLSVQAENGLRIIDIRFTPEQFGFAMTGMHTSDIRAAVFGNYELLDADRQHKEIEIAAGMYVGRKQTDLIEALVAPYEVDGWKAHRDDVTNPHNRTENGVRVGFTRFAQKEAKDATSDVI
jgi:hypothetical protein